MREEKLGTAYPDVDDEKKRLTELLKEAGKVRNKKNKHWKIFSIRTRAERLQTMVALKCDEDSSTRGDLFTQLRQ
ncbi:hypothetical protein CASFOL_001154 [Castilleja foliolosa]|uniref:Uncharacterized protein n=1 Tax=Castilleja foliolosa TaxID=1961234 RepID=A0ABD3EM13_9LAMI